MRERTAMSAEDRKNCLDEGIGLAWWKRAAMHAVRHRSPKHANTHPLRRLRGILRFTREVRG